MYPESNEMTARLDAIFEAHNRSDRPGLVVGVNQGGQRLYRRAFGLACVQQGIVNTPETRMRIGSTSKHFTCLLALLLAEDGLLEIDAPASLYLPELNPALPVPSLRQFMTHTSGYRCSLDIGTMVNHDALQPAGWTLRTLARQTETNFRPGEGQIYCNGGYHLLSLAIERASSRRFEDLLKERIFEPLGMNDTFALPGDDVIVPGMASQHVPMADGRWRRGAFMTNDIKGEGSMVSTIDDMLIWLRHLTGRKVIGSADTWRQMMTPATLANGHQSVYSLGLNQHTYRGLDVIHHGGSVIGTNSQMITVPAHQLDVVVHVNSMSASASELASKVIDAVLGDRMTQPAAEIARHEEFAHLIGSRYWDDTGLLIGFGALGDVLGTSFMGSGFLPIFRKNPDALYAGFEHVALGPLSIPLSSLGSASSAQAPDRITLLDSGNVHELIRLPGEPLPVNLAADGLLGSWYSADAAAEAEFFIEDDRLRLSLRGDYGPAIRWTATAWSEHAYGLEGPGVPAAALAMTVDRTPAGVASFRLNGIRARNLRFLPGSKAAK